jgi:outer membrane protein W
MKKLLVCLMCILSVTFYFCEAIAEAQTSNYVVGKAGFYFPNSSDLGGFNTGFNGELDIGHYFNRNFSAELGVGYFASTGPNGPYGSGWTSLGGGATFYSIPVTLAVKAIYPIDKLEIYGIGGGGAYFVNGQVNATSNSVFTPGGFLGVGVDYNVTQQSFIGIEGRYLWVKPQFTFSNNKYDVNLEGWTVSATFGFRF